MARERNAIVLSFPVIIPNEIEKDVEFVVDTQHIMNGNGIYGDKTRAAKSDALGIARASGSYLYFIRGVVSLTSSLPTGKRIMDASDSPLFNFANDISSVAVRNQMSDLVLAKVKSEYSEQVAPMGATEWLASDPSLARAAFDEYPNLDVIIVDAPIAQLGGRRYPVGVIRSADLLSLSIEYRPDVTVRPSST